MEQKEQDRPPRVRETTKKTLTAQQRQKRKKMLVFPMMFLLFAGSMWLIFAPSGKDSEMGQEGGTFNTEMPSPSENHMIGDKKTAYEQARMEDKQKERFGAMQDLASLFGNEDGAAEANGGLANAITETEPATNPKRNGGSRPRKSIESSTNAYRDMNRTLGNFYEQPQDDPEKEELRQRIDELENQRSAQNSTGLIMDDQIALLEKSYELAAKYMPSGQTVQTAQPISSGEKKKSDEETAIATVASVEPRLVSSLGQPISDTAFIAACSQSHNSGFYTAVGKRESTQKNTIAACIHGNQTVTDGQTVRLRLLEPMNVKGTILDRNAVVTGTAGLQGERLNIAISSLEYGGTITPVNLSVFDNDGQPGIFVPNSMEVGAVKEVAANAGSSLGSSINISTDARAQLASDLGKGLVQGTSQYIAKKMRTVRVHLKSGYKVMLYQPEN